MGGAVNLPTSNNPRSTGIEQPESNSPQDIELQIARYETVEQKRAALRSALHTNPGDAHLQQMIPQFTQPQHLQQAVDKGVFISYAPSEELFVIELADSLREAGVKVWLDMTDIPDDGDWHKEIAGALRRCGLMLMVASPDALKDVEMEKERHWFMESGKLVVPVVYEFCDLDELNLWLPPVNFQHSYRLGLRNLLGVLMSAQAAT